MAHLNPETAFETLKDQAAKTVKGYFPVEGNKNVLRANKVWVDDNKHIDDIKSQTDAKIKGRSWTTPIRAELELVDKKTGKVKDRKTVNVGQLPKITRRYTYIVDGNEWQVANQLRLKSGVYTRVKDNGQLTSQWNLAKGRGFNMNFDPESKKMSLRIGGANVGLYPVLKTLGVADDDIERRWGKEILTANMEGKHENDIRQLYRSLKGKGPESLAEARQEIVKEMGKTQLRPDSTAITLGKPFDKVNGSSLLAGSDKILGVSRGKLEQDDRDSLVFKDVMSIEDLLTERLAKDKRWQIQKKLKGSVDKHTKVQSVVNPQVFGDQIKRFFTSTMVSERPDQLNPLGFLIGNRKTTIGGEHGVTNIHEISLDAQGINPSHLGFLDPAQTPESKRTGTILQMALGAKKVGKDLKIRAYNTKAKKWEDIDAKTALDKTLAFPDQYNWVGGKPVARESEVKVSGAKGVIIKTPPKNVDYVMGSTSGLFDFSTNMIPFLQNTQGTRSMMAAKQAEQAVSLTNREAPLVQVLGEKNTTFEDAVGKFNSHHTDVAGKVEKVSKDGIIIRGNDGRHHEVQLYDNFPLNENKSVLNSEPLVKAGDTVKKGQIVADTNFTRGGKFALGTSLRVAYTPYRGYNFEDGIVISDSAAKRLTSQHLHREGVQAEKNTVLDKNKFKAYTTGAFTKEQIDKLDDEAVIKEGSTVGPGDVLIGKMKVEELTPAARRLGAITKKAIRPVKPRPVTWDADYPAKVSRVVKHGKNTTVFLKTTTPAVVGDKMVGRYGNKGIITHIVPDGEMPKGEDGNHVEVLLNPAGVPSRINLGQVLETSASKIARKTGKPYTVKNFDPTNKNYVANLMKELKSHGLSDTEKLKDPTTGADYSNVFTGEQYFYKLHHMAEKKLQARSRDKYDVNMVPKGGGPMSGQSMDAMGLYALLAHGAKENIREFQTYKSDMNDEFWHALQNGERIPPPKVPFVFKKFEGYLKAMGVNTVKDGNSLTLTPMTDKETLDISNGELKDPARGFYNLKPEAGGLFDPKLTGTEWPHGKLGDKWTHIRLSQRMPNPLFEKPIRELMGVTTPKFQSIIEGNSEFNGKTGPEAITDFLGSLDGDKELDNLEKTVGGLSKNKRNSANKKIRYLRALKKANLNAKEAYTTKYLPVLPPTMRPVSVLDSGDLNWDDVNGLYRRIAVVNTQLKDFSPKMPEEEKRPLQERLYDGLKSLTLTGASDQGRQLSGIVQTLAGGDRKAAKEAYFQDKVIGKRQDMSARGTIVPEPSLSLDEVGLPKKMAMEMYKPFVSRYMRNKMGYSPGEATEDIFKDRPMANRALEKVMEERPVLMKRDPVLHKYGVQAFRPLLTKGKAVKIHPLVTSGYNADFDGDAMTAFVPVSQKAVDEARKMYPSNNLFSPSSGMLMYRPGHESMLGLFKLTEVGKNTGKSFKNPTDAARAVKKGEITLNDVVRIENPSRSMEKIASPTNTTVGRMMVYHSLPKESRREEILRDPKFQMDKKTIQEVLSEVARNRVTDFSRTADAMKDIGNYAATGVSFGLEDFLPDSKYRDHRLGQAESAVKSIKRRSLSPEKLDAAVVGEYVKAAQDISKVAKGRAESSKNRMYDWVKSGARGNWDQFRQMTVAPVLVADSRGKPIPVLIDKSYGEGLDSGSYWASMHGARMGIIGKVKQTEQPGYMSKKLMTSSMNQVVTDEDCGTTKGIALPISERDALGRYTSEDIKLGAKNGKDKGVIPAGTLVDTTLVNRLNNNRIKSVPVRTPLKCSHGEGICAKCYGLDQDGKLPGRGVNLGVIAAQAMGEPMSQLSMNAFHEGGVVGAKGTGAGNQFERLTQLFEFPKTLPGSATLAKASGAVSKIAKDPAGGHNVYVGDTRHFVPLRRNLTVKRGQNVKKGDSLSEGPKNPLELIKLTESVGTVQRYLTDEVKGVYDMVSPVKRRNIETFIRALTNLSEVNDPGSHPEFLEGDRAPTSAIQTFNSKPGVKAVRHTPVLKGTNVLPQEMHTDWLARMQTTKLKNTLLDASAEGWRSLVHGTHPIPGMAYGAEFGQGTEEAPWLY